MSLIRSLIVLALRECFEVNSFKIDSLLVIIPAASLSKGGTNPACKNIVWNIAHDIRYDIGYDISISNIQYDIIYDIGYDICISVYITYLDCWMNWNAWWWRSWRWQQKRLKSLVELLSGHIIIIRQVLKTAGIGSKVGSRSRRNLGPHNRAFNLRPSPYHS